MTTAELQLQVMEPVPWEKAFDDPSFAYQLKWDGVRMLTLIDGDGVSLINRKGASRTAQYPELQTLKRQAPAGTVFDGELVVLADGLPSFQRILQRDLAKQPAVITARMRSLPVTYAVFDLLYLAGEDLRQLPWQVRQDRLSSLVQSGPFLHLVENFSSGTTLYQVVQEAGLEGIVAKRKDSRYIPGKKSDAWRKVKYFREIVCVVGGYLRREGQPRALLLGLYGDEGLIYIGRAGSGMSGADWQAIGGFLEAAESSISPFVNVPSTNGKDISWLQPKLAVQIKFMEWSPDLKLRAPVIKGFQEADLNLCNFSAQGV